MPQTVCPPILVPNAVLTQTHKYMNLGELKRALAKLPPDMNDMEVLLAYSVNGKACIETTAFTGYIPMAGVESIVIGALSDIMRRVKSGEMPKPEGFDELGLDES